MLNPPLLPGLEAGVIQTDRLATHVISRGPSDGEPVILIHGNVSAARFWEELMVALPPRLRVIAPDMRGYGRSETKPLDATRGVRDFSDDIRALIEALGIDRPHLVGWSLGGNVALQYAIDHPGAARSLTLVAPGSPYGYGGTQGRDGRPNSPDFAGSGGGTANPEFVTLLMNGDRANDSAVAPRQVMNSFYFRPPFRSPREEVFVEELFLTHCSPNNYPGDLTASPTWPFVAPGSGGVNNALSPKYLNQAAFARQADGPPVLWVRGDSDQIVSDTSLFDLCMLGQLGAVPGWPGAETHPPQPMVGQLRAVLDEYRRNGGSYREVVLADCGHSPQIERPEEFKAALLAFLDEA